MAIYKMVEKLAAIGSKSIGEKGVTVRAESLPAFLGAHRSELAQMLSIKNGFYAFESALHVFPFFEKNSDEQQNLLWWNAPETWKFAYPGSADRLFAFSEDVFGYQFCIDGNEVLRFDPETGEAEALCGSIEEWAALMCSDFEVQTGYRVAKEWQAANGPIRPGERLVPIYPLISSEGSYELKNFYSVNARKGMLSRADFARQVSGVSDGSQVRIIPLSPN